VEVVVALFVEKNTYREEDLTAVMEVMEVTLCFLLMISCLHYGISGIDTI
jgi:hypothetical protein